MGEPLNQRVSRADLVLTELDPVGVLGAHGKPAWEPLGALCPHRGQGLAQLKVKV